MRTKKVIVFEFKYTTSYLLKYLFNQISRELTAPFSIVIPNFTA